MTEWAQRCVIVVPLALYVSGVAQAMAQVFDPDTGGARSFDSVRACVAGGTVATHAVCDSLLQADTAEVMLQLQVAPPAALHAYCVQDHALRWPDQPPPTLADCAAFLADVRIVIEPRGRRLVDVLADVGLVLVALPQF